LIKIMVFRYSQNNPCPSYYYQRVEFPPEVLEMKIKNVFIVDDDPEFRRFLKEFLERNYWDMLTVCPYITFDNFARGCLQWPIWQKPGLRTGRIDQLRGMNKAGEEIPPKEEVFSR